MAFDMGFDFRSTGSFVTDPAYGVPVLSEVFPHTYTNANGLSINAGWSEATYGDEDLSNTNDPRIAGVNYWLNNGPVASFKVDLASGSAPGAGTYTIDLAIGAANLGRKPDFKVLDNLTVLIDGTNGGAGFTTAAGHYIDATLADVAATTTWTGATVNKLFATTTALLSAGYDVLGNYTTPAHFRLTLVSGSVVAPRLALLGVR